MKKIVKFFLNGAEISEHLFFEIVEYCDDTFLSYKRNDVAETYPNDDKFVVRCNLQIESLEFARYLKDLFDRKNLYFQKCCDHEIL